MIKDKLKLDTSLFTDVIEDALKPDTILNIQNKYDLAFPFTVKRVKCSGLGDDLGRGAIIEVTGYYKGYNDCLIVDGTISIIDGKSVGIGADRFKDFILYE